MCKSSVERNELFPNNSCSAFRTEVFPTLFMPVSTVVSERLILKSFNPRNPSILISLISIFCIRRQLKLLCAKVILLWQKMLVYQIKFCTFALVKQDSACMNRIKEVLDAKELANRLGKTFNMINLYTTNRVQPPIHVLYQIAEILDIDVRELLVSNKI